MAGGFSVLMVVRGLKATTAAYNANGNLLMLSAIAMTGDFSGNWASTLETFVVSATAMALDWPRHVKQYGPRTYPEPLAAARTISTQNPSNARSDERHRGIARRNHSKDHRSQYADAFLVK